MSPAGASFGSAVPPVDGGAAGAPPAIASGAARSERARLAYIEIGVLRLARWRVRHAATGSTSNLRQRTHLPPRRVRLRFVRHRLAGVELVDHRRLGGHSDGSSVFSSTGAQLDGQLVALDDDLGAAHGSGPRRSRVSEGGPHLAARAAPPSAAPRPARAALAASLDAISAVFPGLTRDGAIPPEPAILDDGRCRRAPRWRCRRRRTRARRRGQGPSSATTGVCERGQAH